MPQPLIRLGVVVGLLAVSTAARQDPVSELLAVLERVGQRVEHFFARAQTLICIEAVHWQPLDISYGADGFGRHIESELRVSWDRSVDADREPEVRTVRQVLRANGRPPRPNDRSNCTTPEQVVSEPQPLAMLLPSQQPDYRFRHGGRTVLDRRPVVVLEYEEIKRATVTADVVEGNDECINFDIDGGTRGRIWVDAETYDVLRLDSSLAGYVEVPMPRKVRRPGLPDSWTITRMDQTIRFEPITFEDPDETLVLPVSQSSLRFAVGAGTPRLRTTTTYTRYRRFLTDVKVVGP